jgi:hypothetical protein
MTKKTGKSGNKKPLFTHEQLLEALYHAQDTLERCHTPFVLLDETADAVVADRPLDMKEISLGVLRKHYTQYSQRTLRSLEPTLQDAQVSLTFDYKGVPVVIWIIERHYKYFDYPDLVFYGVETFYIPNPFKGYWGARHLIQ